MSDLSETTDLMTLEEANLPATMDDLSDMLPSTEEAKELDNLATGKFLPRLQLGDSNSTAVKEGRMAQGEYAIISGQDVIPIGKVVTAIPVALRLKALDLSNTESPVSVYDFKSDAFNDIRQRSSIKDSKCMVGGEFLLWLPQSRKFCTYYMASASAKREMPNLKGILYAHGVASLSSMLAKKKPYVWTAPLVKPSTSPLSPEDMPSKADLMAEVERFKNPVEGKAPELADTTATGRER